MDLSRGSLSPRGLTCVPVTANFRYRVLVKVLREIELFFQEGSSDKVYTASIVEDGGAYTVKVAWGRRGSTLNEGAKAVRVALAAAQRKFDALVREKTNKGYQQVTAEVRPAAVAPPVGEGSGS